MSKRKCSDHDEDANNKKKSRTDDPDKKKSSSVEDELFIEITTKGRQILPTNPEKYRGCIYEKISSRSWVVQFKGKDFNRFVTVKTKEEAEAYKMKVNLKEKFVKNMIYEYKNEYYCVLSNMNKLMRFSFQDFDVVDKHIWHGLLGSITHAATRYRDDEKQSYTRQFHQLLSKTESFERKNKEDGLDNRRENLQSVQNKPKAIKNLKTVVVDPVFIEVTTNGTKLYPTNTKKYSGSITKYKNRWLTRISSKETSKVISQYHNTKEEAEAYLKEVNITQNLKIDNIIYKYKDAYYCVLSNQQKLMIFSFEDIQLVEDHTWCTSGRNNYAQTSIINDKGYYTLRSFHQFIPLKLGENETCDHINRNGLDNRRENLRPASKRIQSINKGTNTINTSGTKGVDYDKKNNGWRARWIDVNGKARGKSFSISVYGDFAKSEAEAYRKHIEETLPHYIEALSGKSNM